jgi:hypothetical protein
VVLTARNPERGSAAAARIRADFPGADVELRNLETADLESVRALRT